MDIFIESLTGSIFELKVSPLETINSVKCKIQRTEGISVSQQHLIWQNKELSDDKSLQEYQIKSGATLKLVTGMRGGPINTRRVLLSSPSPVFSSCSTPSVQSSACTSPQPPPYGNNSKVNGNQELSNSTDQIANNHITLLVYKEGNQINFYRVDKNDSGLSPLFEAMSDTSSPRILDDLLRGSNNKLSNTTEEFIDGLIQNNISKTSASKNGSEDKVDERFQEVDSDNSDEDEDEIWKFTALKKENNHIDDGTDLTRHSNGLLNYFPSYLNKGSSTTFSQYMDWNRLSKVTKSSSLLDEAHFMPDEPSISSGARMRERETEKIKDTVKKLKHQLWDQKLRKMISKESDNSLKTPPCSTKTEIPRTPDGYVMRAPSRPLVMKSPRQKLSLTPLGKHEDIRVAPIKHPSPSQSNRSHTPRNKKSPEYPPLFPNHMKKPALPKIPSSTITTMGHKPKICTTDTSSKEKNLTGYATKIGAHSVLPNISKDAPIIDTTKTSTAASSDTTAATINPPVATSVKDNSCKKRPSLTRAYKSPDVISSGRRSSSMGAPLEKSNQLIGSSQETSTVPSSTETLYGFETATVAKPVRQSQRCYECKKKTGLATSYECRCGRNFCSRHRYAELHRCTYDYRSEGRRWIYDSNPLISSTKLPKI